jgi:acetaldehyde dehydrogenase
MIMRNTVFCAVQPDVFDDASIRDRIAGNIHEMVETVRRYVPGYGLRADPQFDPPTDLWRGTGRVGVLLEVRGNGDYLPEYAGNLDIMTSAAAEVGSILARASTGVTA